MIEKDLEYNVMLLGKYRRIVEWASELCEDGQEDWDMNDLAIECDELARDAREVLKL